jgi:hypothetical protein
VDAWQLKPLVPENPYRQVASDPPEGHQSSPGYRAPGQPGTWAQALVWASLQRTGCPCFMTCSRVVSHGWFLCTPFMQSLI